jgi:large subunit ribosomal protein L13
LSPDDSPPEKKPRAAKAAAPKPAAEKPSPEKPSAETASGEPPRTVPSPSSAPAEKPLPTPTAEKRAKPSRPAPPARSAPPRKSPAPRAAAPPGPAPKRAAVPVRPAFPPSATVVDASGLVLGRAASLIAKRLLKGETIVVVNAEKSLVTGNRSMIIRDFTAARARGSVRSGPHYPRFPDRIFRRTVRGMLPHLKTRGKVAFARLHVFIGVPEGLSGRPTISFDDARSRPALRSPMPLGEISTLLGAHL